MQKTITGKGLLQLQNQMDISYTMPFWDEIFFEVGKIIK